jgi:hypothetical protein
VLAMTPRSKRAVRRDELMQRKASLGERERHQRETSQRDVCSPLHERLPPCERLGWMLLIESVWPGCCG